MQFLKVAIYLENSSPILSVKGASNSSCMFDAFINDPSFIYGNDAGVMIVEAVQVELKLNGPVTLSHNSVVSIIVCRDCDMVISNNVTFTSNKCTGQIVVAAFSTS